MTLYVHPGSHLERLSDGLAEVFADAPADPFQPEVVAVPTAGVRDYVVRRLARRLGVSANVEMLFPGRFVSRVLGRDGGGGADDPWHIDRLTWVVLGLLESGRVDVPGWTAACAEGQSRRYAVARRIADLFDGYGANRPQVLQQWASGAPGDGTVRDDGLVGPIDADLRWQFQLWRAARDEIGAPSPAEQLPAAIEALRAGTAAIDLPSRVAWLGLASVAPARIELLRAIAESRDVHLFVMRPSAAQWNRAIAINAGRPTPRRRGDDPAPADVTAPAGGTSGGSSPLLRSWGRAAGEMASLLAGAGTIVGDSVAAAEHSESSRPGRPRATLLGAIQSGIADDTAPVPGSAVADGTVQVHACHGVTRQLEVLRDAIGHLLAADPTLQPHDIVVLCPDIERFEPFAKAVFARGSLPVPLTVTDLSLGSENPVASALAEILRVATGRCTAVDLLGVATLEPVRQRLRIGIDDIDRITGWVDTLGTTWGVDASQRAEWLGGAFAAGDDALTAGTWEAAMRSLLAGVAVPAPTARAIAIVGDADVVPFDDMSADAAAGAGRFAELVARLRHVRRAAQTPRPVAGWCDLFVEALSLLCATDRADAWQSAAATAAIDELRRAAEGTGGDTVELEAADALTLLDRAVAGQHGRLRLRTGAVTLCGLAPMRNVPARVICILGFDEVSLRPAGVDGDDLLGRRPCAGEPDRRGERRQFVLDALLAADEHLVVVCDGSDITTNRRVRFAVQLSELLDTVDATLGAAAGATSEGDSPVVTRHPLRSYDESNFAPAAPFSLDATMLSAALARRQSEVTTPRDLIERWTIPGDDPVTTVSLDDLVQSATRPARTLLRDRLDLRLPGEVSEIDTLIPLSVSPLDAAGVGRRLLEALRSAAAHEPEADVIARWREAESLSGRVPPGRLAHHALDRIEREVTALVDAASDRLGGLDRAEMLAANESVDVDIPLRIDTPVLTIEPTSVRLSDTIDHVVHTDRFGSVLCRLSYTRPKPRAYLEAAVHLAAAVVATGRTDWYAVSATRAKSSSVKPEVAVLGVAGTGREGIDDARRLLAAAAEIHLVARRRSIPLFEETSKLLHDRGIFDEESLVGNDAYRFNADLADADAAFVWSGVPVPDITRMSPPPEVYAGLLWGAVEAFVMDWTDSGAGKGSGSAKATR